MRHVSEADIRKRSVVELLLLAPRLLATCPLDLPASSVDELTPLKSWVKFVNRGEVPKKVHLKWFGKRTDHVLYLVVKVSDKLPSHSSEFKWNLITDLYLKPLGSKFPWTWLLILMALWPRAKPDRLLGEGIEVIHAKSFVWWFTPIFLSIPC